MRLATIGTALSLAAFGIVAARPAELGEALNPGNPERTCSNPSGKWP